MVTACVSRGDLSGQQQIQGALHPKLAMVASHELEADPLPSPAPLRGFCKPGSVRHPVLLNKTEQTRQSLFILVQSLEIKLEVPHLWKPTVPWLFSPWQQQQQQIQDSIGWHSRHITPAYKVPSLCCVMSKQSCQVNSCWVSADTAPPFSRLKTLKPHPDQTLESGKGWINSSHWNVTPDRDSDSKSPLIGKEDETPHPFYVTNSPLGAPACKFVCFKAEICCKVF